MKWSHGLLAAGLVLAATPALAAIDAYLRIPGVEGESKAEQGAIEVSSFSWGVGRGIGSPTGRASDRESSAPSVSEINIVKEVDKASPLLSRCADTGCHYPTVMLSVRKAGGQPVEYVLSNVMVSSVHMSSGGDRPTESITLSFTKMQVKGGPRGAVSDRGTAAMQMGR